VRRRTFVAALGGVAVVPTLIHAEEAAQPIVGYLDSGSETRSRVAAFRDGLAGMGYVEGQNVRIEYRWAEGQYDRLPQLAADLVDRHVEALAATSTPPALAAKAASQTVPIVFTIGNDPVALGLVASLNRPGGNITGFTRMNLQLGPKRLELLHELVPAATVIGLLVNPDNPNAEALSKDVGIAADKLSLGLKVIHARTDGELQSVFDGMASQPIGALLIGPDPFFNTRIKTLAELAISHAIPAMYQYREFVAAGGLASYSASLDASHRQVGVYVGRILAGAKPADLPVEQSTTLSLLINSSSAKAFGLSIPASILALADEVAE